MHIFRVIEFDVADFDSGHPVEAFDRHLFALFQFFPHNSQTSFILDCGCYQHGSKNLNCDRNGKCSCKQGFNGQKCDSCAEGYHGFPDCQGMKSNLITTVHICVTFIQIR